MATEKLSAYVYIVKLRGFFSVNIFLTYDLFSLATEDFIIHLIYAYIYVIFTTKTKRLTKHRLFIAQNKMNYIIFSRVD